MLDDLNKGEKNKLKILGFFSVFLLAIILILSGMIFFAKKNWNQGLAKNVLTVLFETRPDEFANGKYKLGKPIKINSTISVSSNMYEVLSENNDVVKYALITRVTTYYGPLAAVYLYDDFDGVSFEGFACLNGRIKKQLVNRDTDLILKYWNEQAKKIFVAANLGV